MKTDKAILKKKAVYRGAENSKKNLKNHVFLAKMQVFCQKLHHFKYFSLV